MISLWLLSLLLHEMVTMATAACINNLHFPRNQGNLWYQTHHSWDNCPTHSAPVRRKCRVPYKDYYFKIHKNHPRTIINLRVGGCAPFPLLLYQFLRVLYLLGGSSDVESLFIGIGVWTPVQFDVAARLDH